MASNKHLNVCGCTTQCAILLCVRLLSHKFDPVDDPVMERTDCLMKRRQFPGSSPPHHLHCASHAAVIPRCRTLPQGQETVKCRYSSVHIACKLVVDVFVVLPHFHTYYGNRRGYGGPKHRHGMYDWLDDGSDADTAGHVHGGHATAHLIHTVVMGAHRGT